jgi:FkbM family methyltransferase
VTTAEKTALEFCLRGQFNPTIVDLGAYQGEDFEFLESLGNPPVRHIWVEPIDENVQVILRNCRRLDLGVAPEHRTIRQGCLAAISADGKEREIWISQQGPQVVGSSSILEPTGHREHFPDITFACQRWVFTKTLDALFDEHDLSRIDLLYVDIQGAEAEMIRGGANALAKTRFLFMEAEKVEFYRGQVLRPDLLAMLPGWKLIGDFDYNVLLRNENYRA